MTRIASVSYERAHLPKIMALLKKNKRGRVIIRRNGAASAMLLAPEEFETLEILADKKFMLSLLKAEAAEQAKRLGEHEDVFK